MATIPDLLPPEYAAELQKLQSDAPPHGLGVRQTADAARSSAPDWQSRFAELRASSSRRRFARPGASRALGSTAEALACKLQYPDMQSAVEADLRSSNGSLRSAAASTARSTPPRSARKSARACARSSITEREAKHVALYRAMLDGIDIVRVPRAWPELSTGRLLTLDWLDGSRMLAHKNEPLAVRNALATAMFTAWWFPFSRFGVIHGDPHLGNYTVVRASDRRAPTGINLLDYGCIRIFPPTFVRGVVDLYHGLLHRRRGSASCTPTRPGAFAGFRRDLIDTLNIWARFIYGPLLDDRVRTIADGVAPSEYGRREAFRVHQCSSERAR